MKHFRILLLAALLPVAACRLEDPLAGLATSDVISLTTNVSQASADGYSSIILTAELGPATLPNQPITFRTDAGSFSPAAGISGGGQEITLTSSARVAEMRLITATSVNDRVTISATVGDYTTAQSVQFVRSYPEEIEINADDLFLSAAQGSRTDIVVSLFRVNGSVSEGTKVSFALSYPGSSLAEAEISSSALSANGRVSVPLVCKSAIGGEVLVTASVRNAANELLTSKSVTVTFTE